MTLLRKIPAALAALLLAAHFLRAGDSLLVAVSVALAVLAFVPGRAPGVVLRLGLGAGGILWVVTLISIATARSAAGQPYGRLTVILGAVAAFTGLAAVVLPPSRRRDDPALHSSVVPSEPAP